MVDWRDHRPVVQRTWDQRPGSWVRVSCTCSAVLGLTRMTDGLPPVLLLIHRHRSTLDDSC